MPLLPTTIAYYYCLLVLPTTIASTGITYYYCLLVLPTDITYYYLQCVGLLC